MGTKNEKHNVKTDVSGNEGNQKLLNDKVAEVAVAFAEWLGKNKWKYRKGLRWEQLTKRKKSGKLYIWQTIEELYETFERETAKATDR